LWRTVELQVTRGMAKALEIARGERPPVTMPQREKGGPAGKEDE
jgi:hypothetical protein